MITTKEELSVVIPADWVPGPPQGSWTYEDYAALPDDGRRYEIVMGLKGGFASHEMYLDYTHWPRTLRTLLY